MEQCTEYTFSAHRRPRLFHRLMLIAAFSRQRTALSKLDHHLLNDIGVSPDRAQAELKRPIWDVPKTWLR